MVMGDPREVQNLRLPIDVAAVVDVRLVLRELTCTVLQCSNPLDILPHFSSFQGLPPMMTVPATHAGLDERRRHTRGCLRHMQGLGERERRR